MSSLLRNNAFVLVAALGALLQGRPAYAQVGSVSQPMLIKQEVFLVNASNSKVNFQLSCEESGETWDNHSLTPRESASFSCPRVQQIRIRLTTTGGKKVQYKLQVRKRYEVFWNAEKTLWDVVSLRD